MQSKRLAGLVLVCILAMVFQSPVGASLRPGSSTLMEGLPGMVPAAPGFDPALRGSPGDSPLVSAQGYAAARGAPYPADDSNFIADSGGELDLYLFRDHDADGKLRFNIPITRYYFLPGDSQIQFDASGFLKTASPNSLDYVLDKKLLPPTARLTLRAWDVDEDATWCPEVDLIEINGRRLEKGGSPVSLSGANDTWSIRSYDVPVGYLKFPQAKGGGAAPAGVNNEIAIQIDASGCADIDGNPAWAVEIDYGILHIESPVRPIVFAHGWTGNTSTFTTIENKLPGEGIQTGGQADLWEGIYPIPMTAALLEAQIEKALLEYGVNKVNLFAHSKGGLVSRKVLYEGYAPGKVEHLVTFDSPHHGTSWAENTVLMRLICSRNKYPDDPVKAALCYTATQEFRTDTVRETFNYSGCTWSLLGGWKNCKPIYVKDPGTDYRSLAARTLDPVVLPNVSTTFPWDADDQPMPDSLNVTGEFTAWHWTITDNEDAYKCAIHLLDDSRYSCPSAAAAGSADQAALLAEPEQVLLAEQASLPAGGSISIPAVVDSAGMLVFESYSPSALQLTLMAPGGRLINPDVAAADPLIEYYAVDEPGLLRYAYYITSPTAGAWQVQLSSVVAQQAAVSGLSNSSVSLQLTAGQDSYLPGDTMTLQAALVNAGAALPGAVVSGSLQLPAGDWLALSFNDAGAAGDPVAGDGIYTAQTAAADVQANLILKVASALGQVARLSTLAVPVTPQTAQLQGVSVESLWDSDADGLVDALDLLVNVNVLEAGHFDLQAQLVDSLGGVIDLAQVSSRSLTSIEWQPGPHSLKLRFDGQAIWQHGVNGPYTLTGVRLQDTANQALLVDAADGWYSTSAYSAGIFERPDVWRQSASESTQDLDSDGRYDQLTIQLQLGIAKPGTYQINGRLLDPDKDEITWSGTSFDAISPGLFSVNLVFNGADIGLHGKDGPYTLADVSVYQTAGSVLATFNELYTTQSYHFTQFEEGFYRLFLPTASNDFDYTSGFTLYGTITNDLAPAAGEQILLRFYNGASWSLEATAQTGASGDYTIPDLPLLASGQQYSVAWNNAADDPSLLSFYACFSVSDEAMVPGSYECSFDIGGIDLLDPPHLAQVSLPYTFTWTARPVPGDSYEFDLADMYDSNPWFWSPLLGTQNWYTLDSLPAGFSLGTPYGWWVWVYGTNGYGYSYYYHEVTFSAP